MPDDKSTPIFCPAHAETRQDLRDIKMKQDSRHCGANEAIIDTHSDTLDRLMAVDIQQWDAINQLRRMVYMGMGGVAVAAFLGAIIGNIIIAMVKH